MEKKEIQININLGIEILRLILSFWIVIAHCSYIKINHIKYLGRHFHVPTFFLIAFFFYFRLFSERLISKIISRFERLLVPYLIWPIIVLIINNILLSSHQFGYMLQNII